MKPTPPYTDINSRREVHAARATGAGLPTIDHHFRPNGRADFGRCHGSPAPSFRRISEDYFKHEAPGHFVHEAAVFVLMLVTAAVPMIESARGAMHLLRVNGLL